MKSRACPLRSEAETLDFRGAAAPFLPPDTLKKDRLLEEGMQPMLILGKLGQGPAQ
jgi:hypothetical protein